MTTPPRVAAHGFEPVVGNAEENYRRIDAAASDLSPEVTLAVFPELGVSGYDFDAAREVASPIPGPVTDPIVEIARDRELSLVVGVPERDGSSLYNSLAYVTPEGVEDVYRKRFLWGAEKDAFAAGREPTTTGTAAGKMGQLLCYDLNFPEAAFPYAREGCDLIVVSAAWRTEFRHDWRLLTRARALDSTCYVVASNHTGAQAQREHAGHSLVVGPNGMIREETGPEAGSAVAAVSDDELRRARERNPVDETRRQKTDGR